MYCDYLCRVVQGNALKFQEAIIWKATQCGRLRLLKHVSHCTWKLEVSWLSGASRCIRTILMSFHFFLS
jgi:hypothetical protein